jgi:hypothetical protein
MLRSPSLFAVALVVAPVLAVAAAGPFRDVPVGSDFARAITYARNEDIVGGYPDGTFRPGAAVNRAELTKILIGTMYDASDIADCDTASLTFPDVDPLVWYAPYLCLAAQEGIVSGYPDGSFGGEQLVNVAEASKIIARSFFEGDWSTTDPWYAAYLEELGSWGALPTSLSSAAGPLSRGEMVEILYRIDREIDTLPSLDVSDLVAGWRSSDEWGWEEDAGIEVAMAEADCLPGELFDPEEELCYVEIDCDTDEECEALLAEMDATFEGVLDADRSNDELLLENEESIARYAVDGDELRLLDSASLEGVPTWMEDGDRHRQIWELFTRVIPASARPMLAELEITTDGRDETLAAVYQTEADPAQWILSVDVADAFNDDGRTLNEEDLLSSLIHEYGHLLSLNETQVEYTVTAEEEDEYARAVAQCGQRYYTGEGCARRDALIQGFYDRFWKALDAQYDDQLDELGLFGEPVDLYTDHEDDFVTDYAASSPHEDFAESWTAFVLGSRPRAPATLADEKILFFYTSDDLTELRAIIRDRLGR